MQRVVVIALVMAFGVATAAFAQGIGEEAVSVDVQIPEGYSLVAENATLQLFLDADTTQFIVVDRRQNRIWRTNPPGPHDRIPSALWRTHAASQLTFSYTDSRRRQIRQTDPLTEGARCYLRADYERGTGRLLHADSRIHYHDRLRAGS